MVARRLIIEVDINLSKAGRGVQQPKEIRGTSTSLTGLEDVFDVDTTITDDCDQADTSLITKVGTGLTIKEASGHYGLAVPTIRLKIKTSEIPAIKVNGVKGPEWRIFPNGVPHQTDQPDINDISFDAQPDLTHASGFQQPDRSVTQGFHQANINVSSLIKANLELTSKLEAASFRNGYLEAQAESYKNEIKLLTDSQYKHGRWSRFWGWFIGKG